MAEQSVGVAEEQRGPDGLFNVRQVSKEKGSADRNGRERDGRKSDRLPQQGRGRRGHGGKVN